MVKRTPSKYLFRLLVVLIAALGVTSIATAQQQLPLPSGSGLQPNGQRILMPTSSGITVSPSQQVTITNRAIRLADGRVQVIVSLSTAPAVDSFVSAGGRSSRGAADSAARAQKAAIDSQQASFASAASGVGATVVRGTWFTVNSVTVAVAPSQIAALAALPGVTHIQPDAIITRDDTVSVPFIEADDVWAGFGGTGYTGGYGRRHYRHRY